MADTLVVCIGNDLVADDGVGHAVHKVLAEQVKTSNNIRVRLLGLGGMSLLDEFAGERHLIVVDAVQFGTEPGTIHVMEWSQIPASVSHVSCHGIGIREAIEVSRKLYPENTPQTIHLVGVEGKCFDQLGEGLTKAVAQSIGPAVKEVMNLIATEKVSGATG